MTTEQNNSANDPWLTAEWRLLSEEAKGLLDPKEPAHRLWEDPRLAEIILHWLGPRWSQAVEEFKRTGALSILLFAHAHEIRNAFQLGVQLGRSDNGKQARQAKLSKHDELIHFTIGELERWIIEEWPAYKEEKNIPKREKPTQAEAIRATRDRILAYQRVLFSDGTTPPLREIVEDQYKTIRSWIKKSGKLDLFDPYHTSKRQK